MRCGALQAQDGHLSHYDAAPALLNPALTGMYNNADFRMTSNVRSQWNSLSSSFTTTGFGYDVAMQDRYGFGMYLNNYNMAGIMNTFQSGLSAAYNAAGRDSRYILSGGFNLGILYKKLNDQQLVWDAQYDNGYFNTDLPSGETIMRGARLMLDIAGGISYKATNARQRVNPFANAALFHVNTPNEAIFGTQSDLPIRYSVNARGADRTDGQHLLDTDGIVHAPGCGPADQRGHERGGGTPTAGSKVKGGRTIYVKINADTYKMVAVPDLIEKTYRQALPSLKAVGLVEGEKRYVPSIAKDLVLEMWYKGKRIKAGERVLTSSKVDLVLGDGSLVFNEKEIDSIIDQQPSDKELDSIGNE